jgi:hypothetical protein
VKNAAYQDLAGKRRSSAIREKGRRGMADLFPEVPPGDDDLGDERYTCRETIDWCKRVAAVGNFDLDVAACEESHWAPLWYSKRENGLHKPWFGDVWCNPPYSDIAPWVTKTWDEFAVAVGPVGPSLLIGVSMLIPATRTEQAWWQRDIEPYRDGRQMRHGAMLTAHFLPGRTSFARPGSGGVGQSGSPFGCVLLVWRREPRRPKRPNMTIVDCALCGGNRETCGHFTGAGAL